MPLATRALRASTWVMSVRIRSDREAGDLGCERLVLVLSARRRRGHRGLVGGLLLRARASGRLLPWPDPRSGLGGQPEPAPTASTAASTCSGSPDTTSPIREHDPGVRHSTPGSSTAALGRVCGPSGSPRSGRGSDLESAAEPPGGAGGPLRRSALATASLNLRTFASNEGTRSGADGHAVSGEGLDLSTEALLSVRASPLPLGRVCVPLEPAEFVLQTGELRLHVRPQAQPCRPMTAAAWQAPGRPCGPPCAPVPACERHVVLGVRLVEGQFLAR